MKTPPPKFKIGDKVRLKNNHRIQFKVTQIEYDDDAMDYIYLSTDSINSAFESSLEPCPGTTLERCVIQEGDFLFRTEQQDNYEGGTYVSWDYYLNEEDHENGKPRYHSMFTKREEAIEEIRRDLMHHGKIPFLQKKSIYDLAFEEEVEVAPHMYYTRVPGGWIREKRDEEDFRVVETFIPWDNEFQGDSSKDYPENNQSKSAKITGESLVQEFEGRENFEEIGIRDYHHFISWLKQRLPS